ncbi:MAG: insulinase family protein [candidate division Zixibacteria bacterium]|nr:insulinase family protein [candidate division Zixibacteria bacterium]
MIKRPGLLLLCTAISALIFAPTVFGFDFSTLEESVSETTLDNGLKIIVMERHNAPVVSCVTYANVGGADDPKEYTGVAHMLEHMAFKGTRNVGSTDLEAELAAMKVEDSIFYLLRAERAKGRFADSARLAALETDFEAAIENARQYVVPNAWDARLEREGAVGINAGTSKDNTSYIMSLPSNRLELWMAMESDRFLNPVLREMYRERNVIAEERRQVLENNPIMRTIDAMQSAAFTAHPYGISIVGHMSDIQNYTRDAVKEYFHKYYVPSNMIVSIVGDVKAKDVFKMAETYFGRIPAAQHDPHPVATKEPVQKGEKRVNLQDQAQPLFIAGWHVPEGTHPDWPALDAMTDYLGQGRTSLLYKNLVKEKKIAGDVGVYLGWPGNKYPCLAFAYAMPAPDHSNEECEEQIFAEVERLQTELIPAEEVDKIKARAKAGFIRSMRSNLGMASALAEYENDWHSWRELFRELDRINAVTAEDIQRVAKEYLTEDNRTVAKLNNIES